MSIQAKHAWSAHVPFKIFNVFPSCCDLSEPGNFTAEWHEPKNAKHRSNGTSEPSERLNGWLHWKHGFAATRSWIFRIGSTHYPRSPDIFKEGFMTSGSHVGTPRRWSDQPKCSSCQLRPVESRRIWHPTKLRGLPWMPPKMLPTRYIHIYIYIYI